VEHAVQQRAFHECHHSRADDRLGVDAGVFHAGHVVELEARETFHHDDAARHQLGVRARNHIAVLLQVGEDARDVEHVGGFEAEVEFFHDRLGEQLDERRRIRERGDLDAPDQERSQPRHHLQVFAHERADLRSLHFDHDRLAGAQHCGVHLGDRGGGNRRGLERREHVFEPGSEVFFDNASHVVERLRRHLIAAALELFHEFGGEESFAARDDLRELDVRRTESLDGVAHAQRQIGARRLGRLVLVAAPFPPPRAECDAETEDDHDESRDRRHARSRHQRRKFFTRLHADALHETSPAHGVFAQHPRCGAAERAPLEVGRCRCGRDSVFHPRSLPMRAPPASRPAGQSTVKFRTSRRMSSARCGRQTSKSGSHVSRSL